MKSRNRHKQHAKFDYHGFSKNEGHEGKPAAVSRKLKRGDYAKMLGHKVARAERPALSKMPRKRAEGTGAGTSCPH